MRTVTIKIPASPAYLHVIRIAAAGLASRVGFTIDEIEDLKIAVDELSAYLTGTNGREGDLRVRFHVHDEGLDIEGEAQLAPGQKVRTDLTEFSRMILETVVDEADLGQTDGRPSFTLRKSRGA